MKGATYFGIVACSVRAVLSIDYQRVTPMQTLSWSLLTQGIHDPTRRAFLLLCVYGHGRYVMLYVANRYCLFVVPLWRSGACDDQSKTDRLATPTKTKTSPRSTRTLITYASSGGSTISQQETRPRSVTASSTSSIGVQGDLVPTTKPSAVVDGSSNTTPRPPSPPLAGKPTSLETEGEGKAGQAAPVALVSTGVSASDVPPFADSRGGGSSASAETVGTATDEVVTGVSSAANVGTTRKSSKDMGSQVGSGPVEVSDGGPPVTQDGEGAVIPSVTTVAAGAERGSEIQEGPVSSDAGPSNSEQAVKQLLPSVGTSSSSSIDVGMAAAKNTAATSSAAVPTEETTNGATKGQEVGEAVDNAVDREGPAENGATMAEAGENAPNMATGAESNNSEDGGEGEAHPSAPNEGVQETWEKETEEHGGGGSERRSTDTGRSSGPVKITTSTTAGAAVEDANAKSVGRDRYESLDGETLLGKLLDSRASSAVFEDDHQRLLQKVMRVRDDEHVSHNSHHDLIPRR